MTLTLESSHKSNTLGTLVLLVGVAIIGIVFIASAIPNSNHAISRHGTSTVSAVRTCISNPSSNKQVWKSKRDSRFYVLCQMESGNWGLQPRECINGKWIEVTAFIPEDGTWNSVVKYMEKFSTKFNGEVECK